MIYRERKEIQELIDSRKNKPIWACAYELQNNKNKNGLIQKPVQGEFRNEGYVTYFYHYKKNSKEFAKSKAVQAEWSRYYADTYEECVTLYNTLVNEAIMYFWQRMRDCVKDKIGNDGIKTDNPDEQQVFNIFYTHNLEDLNESS